MGSLETESPRGRPCASFAWHCTFYQAQFSVQAPPVCLGSSLNVVGMGTRGAPSMLSDYDLMTDHTAFGDLCLNYCEIGKTLEDFWRDQDEYVTANTFKPFRYFSADFNVRLYELSAEELQEQRTGIAEYYQANQKEFESAGIRDRRHPHLKAGTIVVAKMIPEHRDTALTVFAEHPFVSNIELI